MMKKIIALLLALVCMFSLVSCFGNDKDDDDDDDDGKTSDYSEDLETIAQEFANAEAVFASGSVKMIVAVDSETEETQEIVSKSELYYEPNEKNNQYNHLIVQCFVPLSFDEYGNGIIPDSDTIEFEAARGVTEISFSALTFEDDVFSEYELQTNYFTAVISDPSTFFGVEIATSEATLKVQRGPYGPRKVEIKYVTDAGYEVEIVVQYKYE